MSDNKFIAEILGTEKQGISVFGLRLSHVVSKKLKEIRTLVIRGEDFSDYGKDGEDISVWLYENFPRLEEASKQNLKTVLYMGRLAGKKGLPLFFRVFSRVLRGDVDISEDTVDAILDKCNNYGKGLDLRNGRSLIYLFRLAVCMRILECFSDAFHDSGDRDLLSEIEKLFCSLDVLLAFGNERAIKNNPVEKILSEDPAELYSRLTDETKASYRKNLAHHAKKSRMSEPEFAREIVEKCSRNTGSERHIGFFLCDKPHGGKTYLFLLVFLSVLFTVLLCLVSPLLVVSVFSVYGCTKLLLDKIYSKFIVREFRLPAVRLSGIPEEHGVMVVITSLLTADKSDDEIFERLEKIYYSNGGRNVYFAALCDLCDSKEKESENDRQIMHRANKLTVRLRQKYGDVFFLFLREKEYSVSEEVYMAPERKRGAVADLTSFLCGKSDTFCDGSIKPTEEICNNIKYVLTLDADTNPQFDCVVKMAGIMIHPQNMPVWDKKKAVVIKGYGILQPAMNPTLSSAKKSIFTTVLCGHGGVDGYANARADASMFLFGRGIFCGKGMFEKNCFYDLLCADNSFRRNFVLSHDAPEGARLRCANIPDITFTDSFPSEELSYFKRQHRWIRGDIQNIPFLLSDVCTSDGRKIKNFIHYASRFFMWGNVFSALNPVFTVVLLFVSAFCDDETQVLMVTVAMSVYILPFVYSVFSLPKKRIWHNVSRRFYSSGIYTGIWTAFFRMLLSVCMLVKEAQVSFDAVIRSIYRSVVSHRKMLEWTTAAQNDKEKKDGLLGYVRKNLLSAGAGTVLFAVSDNGFLKAVALMWLFLPVIAYHTGRERKEKQYVASKKQRETVMSYCRDMWKYFSENVNESTSFLPTDNVSLYPERKMSRMTSPTNIGLYLLSVMCARKLGLIDSKELGSRLCDTLSSVTKLCQFDGLLYNWYDIFTKQPMNPAYVSSVDVGNYSACLICVCQGIEEYGDEMTEYARIKEMLDELIENCRFEKLYDRQRRLFYIGGRVEDGKFIPDKNHYDMLMSEARILSFTAVALRSVPSEHYMHLSRVFVKGGGYMGLASWSGTAFEYFMPEIFFPSEKGTLLYEALCFSYSAFKHGGILTKNGYVFGISESCYNESDDAANYKYRAFGIPEIALDVIKKQNVISPYSSFLFMNFAPVEALGNLVNLEKNGVYGEYGFYESVDFERHEKNEEAGVVKCFMSHHVGMSIAACTNFLYEGYVSELFSDNKKIDSALEITHEMIPYDSYVKRIPRRHYKYTKKRIEIKNEKCSVPTLTAHLSDGRIKLFAKRNNFEIKYKELLTARKKCFTDSLGAFRFGVEIDRERFFFNSSSNLLCSSGRIRYTEKLRKNTGEIFEASLNFTLVKNTSDTVYISVNLKKMSGRNEPEVVFFAEFYPLLDIKTNNRNCFFFDGSDIVAEIDDDKEVYFRRNSNNICFYAGAVHGKKKSAKYENERIILTAQPCITEGGTMNVKFAISFSESRKCAQMGLSRCTETGFDKACVELVKRNELRKPLREDKLRPKRANDVMGYAMIKEETTPHFPIDSKEKGLHLLCGRNFSCVVSENSVGVSFVRDINNARITAFSGLKDMFETGEKIVFENDGFDLCKQAKERVFLAHAAKYYGTYNGRKYTVSVTVSPDLPCKIICVDFDGSERICFDVLPDENLNRQRHIGSGLVFFDGIENKNEKGFVFGLKIHDRHSIIGAEYSLRDRIRVYFRENVKEEPSDERYMFCIGFSSEEAAFEIQKKLRETDFENVSEESERFCKQIAFFSERVPLHVKDTLGKYFVFPKRMTVSRALVEASCEIFLFDALLTVYSDSSMKHAKAKDVAEMKVNTVLQRLMKCLFAGEYFRVTSDTSFLEKSYSGETLYRSCLSYLLDAKENSTFRDLHVLCLEVFSNVCYSLGDVRTHQLLLEKKRKISFHGKDGIFL